MLDSRQQFAGVSTGVPVSLGSMGFGSGQDDLWGGNSSGMTILHYNGTTFVESLFGQGARDFADFNDDGCTDVLMNGGIYLSGCNGSPGGVISTPNFSAIALIDWDGDGRKDLLTPGNGSTCTIYLSTGSGFNPTPIFTNIPSSSCTSNSSTIPNAAGDGLDGLLLWTNSSPILYYPHNGVGRPPDLLTNITDGYGNSVSPSYVSLARSVNGTYFEWNDAQYPYENYHSAVYITNQAVFSDPSSASGATYYQNHYYSGLWLNLQGRGFAPFGAVQTYDSRTSCHYTMGARAGCLHG